MTQNGAERSACGTVQACGVRKSGGRRPAVASTKDDSARGAGASRTMMAATAPSVRAPSASISQ